jgi:sortase A
LEGVRLNDVIVFTAQGTEYRYRVTFSQVVGPDDVAVLDPTGGDVLTLVTCHPFYFVGPAPNRFIVRAARV